MSYCVLTEVCRGNESLPTLQLLVKAGLILSQTNAKFETTLFVTKNRPSLWEPAIVGLCGVKEAVHIHDLVLHKPQYIPVI